MNDLNSYFNCNEKLVIKQWVRVIGILIKIGKVITSLNCDQYFQKLPHPPNITGKDDRVTLTLQASR